MNRFSVVDVKAAVYDMQNIIGLRAANIYNVGPKAYVFKVSLFSLLSSLFSFSFSFSLFISLFPLFSLTKTKMKEKKRTKTTNKQTNKQTNKLNEGEMIDASIRRHKIFVD